MNIFKTKAFVRWAKSNKISDKLLKKSVAEMQAGLIDANLGGGVVKKRIGLGSRGKSSGARTIVAFKTDKNIFFLFGFLKNEQENIDRKELKALKQFAEELFKLRENNLEKLLKNGDLFKVK